MLNEELLEIMLRENKNNISLKKQKALYKELKNVMKNTRMWFLNGFTPLEVASTIKKEKVGRNEPCICGSGKKYKHCCGK